MNVAQSAVNLCTSWLQCLIVFIWTLTLFLSFLTNEVKHLLILCISSVNHNSVKHRPLQNHHTFLLPLTWASNVAALPSSATTLCSGCVNVGAWVDMMIGTLEHKRGDQPRIKKTAAGFGFIGIETDRSAAGGANSPPAATKPVQE